MFFLKKRPPVDLPIHEDTSQRLMSFGIGLLMFLLFLMGLAFALYQASQHQAREGLPNLVVAIPLEKQAATVQKNTLRDLLTHMKLVNHFEIMPQEQLRDLARSVTETSLSGTPPAPIVVNIWAAQGGQRVLKKLMTHFKGVHGTFYTQGGGRSQWLAHVIDALFWCVCLLFGAALVTLFILSARTSLRLYKPVLDFLVLMGASRGYIRRQLQHQMNTYFWRGLLYAVLFSVLAFFVVWVLLSAFMLEGLVLEKTFLLCYLLFFGIASVSFLALVRGVVFWEVRSSLQAA